MAWCGLVGLMWLYRVKRKSPVGSNAGCYWLYGGGIFTGDGAVVPAQFAGIRRVDAAGRVAELLAAQLQ